MQFLNDSKAKFVHFFGEAALQLIEAYPTVTLIMADRGMFPAIEELGPVAACVSAINLETLEVLPEDFSKRSTVLIVYPEMIHADTVNWPVQLRDKHRVSVLVHELEHVKQVVAGRLVIIDKTKVIWEGEERELSMASAVAYVQFPWEREAFIAQFTFMAAGVEAMGEQSYNTLVTMQKEAAGQ